MDKIIEVWFKNSGKFLVIVVMIMMLFMVGAIGGMRRVDHVDNPDIVLSYRTTEAQK